MYCTNCGNQINENGSVKFCPVCGAPTTAGNAGTGSAPFHPENMTPETVYGPPPIPPVPPKKKGSGGLIVLLAVVAALLLTVAVLLSVILLGKRKSPPAKATAATQVSEETQAGQNNGETDRTQNAGTDDTNTGAPVSLEALWPKLEGDYWLQNPENVYGDDNVCVKFYREDGRLWFTFGWWGSEGMDPVYVQEDSVQGDPENEVTLTAVDPAHYDYWDKTTWKPETKSACAFDFSQLSSGVIRYKSENGDWYVFSYRGRNA